MPELPEVETVRRQLAPRLTGRRAITLEIRDPRWCAPRPPAELVQAVCGRRIEALRRRGKFLIFELESDRFLVCHLRMTGTLLYDPLGDPAHTRVGVELDDGHRLAWVDPRRFGTGEVAVGSAALAARLARLGVEPLEPGFTPTAMRSLARGSRTPIKAFLLDQHRIAGVGNIYADEALHRAGIHPLRPAGRVTLPGWSALCAGVRAALTEGIEAGGATIDDFRHLDGARGAYQDAFRVHRRAGEPCPECGTPVRKLVAAGRGTYVCERCQRRPRATRRAR